MIQRQDSQSACDGYPPGWEWFHLSSVLNDFPDTSSPNLCTTMKAEDVTNTLTVADFRL